MEVIKNYVISKYNLHLSWRVSYGLLIVVKYYNYICFELHFFWNVYVFVGKQFLVCCCWH